MGGMTAVFSCPSARGEDKDESSLFQQATVKIPLRTLAVPFVHGIRPSFKTNTHLISLQPFHRQTGAGWLSSA